MANGKEASGLVPRVAWESWAPSQLALGPGRISTESCLTTVCSAVMLGSSASPGHPCACNHPATVGFIQVYFPWAMSCPGSCSLSYVLTLKLRFGKSSGEKTFCTCSQNITHVQRASLADLQLHEHRFGRTGVKFSSKYIQSLELVLQL